LAGEINYLLLATLLYLFGDIKSYEFKVAEIFGLFHCGVSLYFKMFKIISVGIESPLFSTALLTPGICKD
jgi:hypothetical protein